MNGATGKIVRLGVLIALTATAVTGCVSPFKTAKVDPTSPIAEQASAAARYKGRRPTFADIPAIPTDVRGPARIKAVVEAEQRAAAKLRRDAAPETFKLTDTEGYAARARAAAKAPDFGAPTEADRANTEAFAAAARGRASAPSSQPK
ncbi:hypothetical protein [Caulobacter sp. DWR1-3-2b1]|uniref:hypothetical protein n=1 Tax=Caulobacter sp. DWR1-3-2b1 TaxID=2804670 RepID=UPI003CF6A915